MESGSAWIVDAYGCSPERLKSEAALNAMFAALVEELNLHPVRPAV